MIKRLFDVVLAFCVLLVTWPLILIGALAAKLTSPGPALYRAKRAGLGGQPFDMLKLRTMYVGMDTPDRRVTAERDDRITPVGALLRKFKIDELPQFWNVLKGDMSIVGPRPEDWDIVEQYYTPEQRCTLEITPGVKGGGNTDPEGLAVLFAQPVHDSPDNAFSRLLQHEVLLFKSCFPNSAIRSDEGLEQRKTWYLQMRDVIDQHPDRIFIFLTTPPLHPEKTTPEDAARARALVNWLQSDEFLAGRPNLFVFDFFDLLADPETNVLRTEYQRDPDSTDSHPNTLANQTIGPLFVGFVDKAVQTYRANQ
jgi:hypothetical protein